MREPTMPHSCAGSREGGGSCTSARVACVIAGLARKFLLDNSRAHSYAVHVLQPLRALGTHADLFVHLKHIRPEQRTFVGQLMTNLEPAAIRIEFCTRERECHDSHAGSELGDYGMGCGRAGVKHCSAAPEA